MNIIDVIIILGILVYAVTGFVRGFFKETVMFLGTIVVVILSFLLKNPLSLVLYKYLPFIKFGGLSSLNILLYEVLAFIIALAILSLALGIVIKLTGIIEKVLKLTIILAIPSKILGFIVGIIQGWVIVYVILFIVSMPIFKVPFLDESKYSSFILKHTPVISNIVDDLVDSFDEIHEFTKKQININDVDNVNRNILEIMMKNDIVTNESVKYLVDNKKINIKNVDELLEKYKEENNDK